MMDGLVNDILEMVQNILGYFQEGDAVNVIEIIKNSLAEIFARSASATFCRAFLLLTPMSCEFFA